MWRIAPGVLNELLLLGASFGAERAREIGLATSVVAEADLSEELNRLAGQLLTGGPTAQREIKRLLRSFDGLAHRERQTQGREFWARMAGNPESQQGVAAFLERVPAPWVDSGKRSPIVLPELG
jgi:methylglutaconyl-CoA hydratase